MRRAIALALLLPCPMLGAQSWQGGNAVDVVTRAVSERERRDSATVLAGWQALARGTVRFAAVIRHGEVPIERVIRVDALHVEVYGEAPDRSKQVIVAWRDTVLQPTRIAYHRDHLGIVTHDFGSRLRLGEGDEVRDVPHPLSRAGLAHYAYRLGDTLVMRNGADTVRVVAVEVRPDNPLDPGTVGTVYLDADRAAVVRFDFTFTRSAYRDPTVASITVRLENALQDRSWWLPWRQSLTITREAPWVALPLESVIRADWTIDDYQLGVRHPPARFGGAAIGGLAAPDGSAELPLDLEGDAGEPTGETVAETAHRLVRASLLEGLPALRFAVDHGVSGILRINRVQGITPGAGMRLGLGAQTTLTAHAAIGLSDHRPTGDLGLRTSRSSSEWRVGAGRFVESREVLPRRSGVMNSLATAVTGDDAGDWYEVDRVVASATHRGYTAGVAHEAVRSRVERFTAIDGEQHGNPALGGGSGWRAWAALDGRSRTNNRHRLIAEVGDAGTGWWRSIATATAALPHGSRFDLAAGASGGSVPPHLRFVLGGAGSVPGSPARSITGSRFLRMIVERPLAVGIPAPGPLGAGGISRSALVPIAGFAIAGGESALEGLQPIIGVRFDLWGPILRFEAAWNPRLGTTTLGVDAHPDWWPLL